MLAVEYLKSKSDIIKNIMNTILELEWSSQFTKQLQLERSFKKNNNNNKKTPGLNRNRMLIALHTALPSELSNDLGTGHLNHNVEFRKRKLLGKETLTGELSLLHLASRNHKEGILKCNTLRGTELGQCWWHSSSTNMPLLGFPDWLSNVDWVCWLLWLLEVFSL